MKKIWIGAVALLLIAGAAQAQDTTRNRHRGKNEIENLNLTTDQKTKLQALREAQQKERTALKKKNEATTEKDKKQHRELAQKHQAQLKAILTPEQQAQLAQARKEYRKEDKIQNGGRFKENRNALNLTEAQQTKMKALHKDFRAKRQTLRNNASLTETQKQEQLKAMAQQHRTEIKNILTTEQQQKLETLRKERRKGTGK